jgi:hypothetical protein
MACGTIHVNHSIISRLLAVALDHRRRPMTGFLHSDLIVRAAEQRRDRLCVLMREAIASVTGTALAVSAGTRGSVVPIVEGSVAVNQPRREVVLSPGEHVCPRSTVEALRACRRRLQEPAASCPQNRAPRISTETSPPCVTVGRRGQIGHTAVVQWSSNVEKGPVPRGQNRLRWMRAPGNGVFDELHLQVLIAVLA